MHGDNKQGVCQTCNGTGSVLCTSCEGKMAKEIGYRELSKCGCIGPHAYLKSVKGPGGSYGGWVECPDCDGSAPHACGCQDGIPSPACTEYPKCMIACE